MKPCLQDVSLNKGLNINLTSLTRKLVNSWEVISGTGNANGIQIKKGDSHISSDIVTPTPKGAVFVCHFLRDIGIVASSTETGVCMGIQKKNIYFWGTGMRTPHISWQGNWDGS